MTRLRIQPDPDAPDRYEAVAIHDETIRFPVSGPKPDQVELREGLIDLACGQVVIDWDYNVFRGASDARRRHPSAYIRSGAR